MDFSQFLMFCIERNMVSNKHGLEIFYAAFKDAVGSKFDVVNNNGIIDTAQFYYAMLQLARILYVNEEKPFEAMFQKMLIDNVMTKDHRRKLALFLML